MSKNFSELPLAEQMEVAQKVGEALKRNDIKAKVDIYREEVCQLTTEDVKGRTMLKCEKSLPSTQADKADAFNKAI